MGDETGRFHLHSVAFRPPPTPSPPFSQPIPSRSHPMPSHPSQPTMELPKFPKGVCNAVTLYSTCWWVWRVVGWFGQQRTLLLLV